VPQEIGEILRQTMPVMREICKTIGLIADNPVNVLIMGESGAGKERWRARSTRPSILEKNLMSRLTALHW